MYGAAAQSRSREDRGIPDVPEQSTSMPIAQPRPGDDRARTKPGQTTLTKFRPGYPYAPTAKVPATPVRSLAEAIALAYTSNPRLLSERATLRAIDERYSQAMAGYHPSIDVTARVGYAYDRNDSLIGPKTTQEGWSDTIGATASQSLYSFGRNRSAQNIAVGQIAYEREVLRGVETQVMLSVISRYVEVIRDARQVTIAATNEAILDREYQDDSARFNVREITVADLEQVRSRLEAAKAGLLEAKAQLAVSQAGFLHDVGAPPGELGEPSLLRLSASTLSEALAEAEIASPIVTQAQDREKISRARRQAAEADRLPRIDARGTASVGSLEPYSTIYRSRRLQGELVFTVPVLDGGLRAARVAEARESNQADWLAIEEAVRESRNRVTSAWNGLAAARASLAHYFGAVQGARNAFEGARIQERAGARTTVEVLDFARDLLIQETNYNTALANEYLYRADLLAAMGRLEAPRLEPAIVPYDPAAHFEMVQARSSIPIITSMLSALDGLLVGGISKDRPLGDPASNVQPVSD